MHDGTGAIFCWEPLWSRGSWAQEKTTVIDLEKRIVEVPKNPERLICLGPGSLRLICYLGM